MSKLFLILAVAFALGSCSPDDVVVMPIEEQVLGTWERIAWPNTTLPPAIEDSWEFKQNGQAIWRIHIGSAETVNELTYRVDEDNALILFNEGLSSEFQCLVAFQDAGSHMTMTEDAIESHYSRDE